jgi:hypothetical protein
LECAERGAKKIARSGWELFDVAIGLTDVVVETTNFGGEKMKKMLVLLMVAGSFGLLPSISQAMCTAVGAIPRVTVASVTTVQVRSNSPGSVTFSFVTADDTFIHAAVVAEQTHANVTVMGSATTCGAVLRGVSAGGTINQIIVSP